MSTEIFFDEFKKKIYFDREGLEIECRWNKLVELYTKRLKTETMSDKRAKYKKLLSAYRILANSEEIRNKYKIAMKMIKEKYPHLKENDICSITRDIAIKRTKIEIDYSIIKENVLKNIK